MNRYRETALLLGLALLVSIGLDTAVVEAAPKVRIPRGAERIADVGTVKGPGRIRAAAVVYKATYRLEKESRTSFMVALAASRGAPIRPVVEFRIPRAYGEGQTYKLDVIDLRDGHHLLRFTAKNKLDDTDTEPRYTAFAASPKRGREYQLLWSGSYDPIDESPRVRVEDVDGDNDYEVLQVRSQTRTLFCGRSSAQLFPRVWDFDASRFRPLIALGDALERMGAVRASLDKNSPVTSHFPNLVSYRTASSDLRDIRSGREARVSLPTDLGDGEPRTAWIEGVPGWGVGEFVTADINPAFSLRGVRIVPGHAASDQIWKRYARPKTLIVAFDNDTLMRVDVPDVDREKILVEGGLYIALPAPIRSQCMTIIIADVYPATKPWPGNRVDDGRRTAISELTPLLDLDYEPRQEAVRRVVNAIIAENSVRRGRALTSLAKGLGRELGPAVRTAIQEELDAPTGSGKPGKLIPLLPLLDKEDEEEAIRQLLSSPKLTRGDLAKMLTTVSLESQGSEDLFFDLALDDNNPELVRERATRIVGRAGRSERMKELLPLTGKGSKQMRKNVIRGLARADVHTISPLLDKAVDEAGTHASHDALWALDRLLRREFRGKPAEIDGSERIIVAYNKSGEENIQIRIRAMRLFQRVIVPNGDLFLATVLDSNERPEVRVLAAEALENYRTGRSTEALLDALRDNSPSVRIQACRTLRSRPNLPTVVEGVGEYARSEDWTAGREQAYLLLAESTAREGADYLYQLIEGGDDQRKQLALQALNAARNNIRSRPLMDIIEDKNQDFRIRQLAVKTLAWTRDKPSEQLLITMVQDEEVDARMRRTIIRTLGRRKSDTALFVLQKLAQRHDEPLLQNTAVRVLAYYDSKEALGTLEALDGTVNARTQRYVERAIDTLKTRLRIKKLGKTLDR